MSWTVEEMVDEVHIIPPPDEEHIRSRECWCNPFVDRDSEGRLRVNHNVETYKPSHGPRR